VLAVAAAPRLSSVSMGRLEQHDYERLLAFRTGLRRFLAWSGQQAEAAGITPAQHQLLLAIRGHPDPRGLKGAQTRSCSSPVLVQQTAEQVGPTHSGLLILGVNGQPGGLI
jgi:hypothetical protein